MTWATPLAATNTMLTLRGLPQRWFPIILKRRAENYRESGGSWAPVANCDNRTGMWTEPGIGGVDAGREDERQQVGTADAEMAGWGLGAGLDSAYGGRGEICAMSKLR